MDAVRHKHSEVVAFLKRNGAVLHHDKAKGVPYDYACAEAKQFWCVPVRSLAAVSSELLRQTGLAAYSSNCKGMHDCILQPIESQWLGVYTSVPICSITIECNAANAEDTLECNAAYSLSILLL